MPNSSAFIIPVNMTTLVAPFTEILPHVHFNGMLSTLLQQAGLQMLAKTVYCAALIEQYSHRQIYFETLLNCS